MIPATKTSSQSSLPSSYEGTKQRYMHLNDFTRSARYLEEVFSCRIDNVESDFEDYNVSRNDIFPFYCNALTSNESP
jgi:hypothetical protein